MHRLLRLLALALALSGVTPAIAQPRIDLAVTPAWNGWSRPGRATEVDIRLATDTATRVTLDVVAGRQVVHADLDLQPGRAVRLHVPVSSVEGVAVSAGSPAGPPVRREVALAQSESPLLGVGLVTDDPVRLEGFHTVRLDADDLPRNASAYASVDALVLDAPTLGALDAQQLGALLAHAAECGRIVLLNPDPGVRRVLDGAGGCAGRFLMSSASLADATEMLASALTASRVPATPVAGIGEFARPDQVTWNRVLAVLAAYFAAAALVILFFSSLPVLLLVPALATVAILALLHLMQPPSQLVVWSEGESGTRSARFQAWQSFPGLVRGRTRVPVLPQLAFARSCDPTQPMRFDFDAGRERVTFAEFDTRLFRQITICYSGSFPLARAIGIDAGPDGSLEVRNAGSVAWPRGLLLAGGLVHDLPALDPGANTILRNEAGKPRRDALVRTAMTRIRADGAAALWELELGGVASAPLEAQGWLLVSVAPP